MTTTKTNRRTLTSTAAATGNVLDYYRDTLKSWPVKYAGPKPTAAEFEKAASLGPKHGTKTAIALAMYFRAAGADGSQVAVINSGPYLNAMRNAVAAGHAVAVPMPAADGHKVYKLALPVKGKAAGKAAGKATKAADKGKVTKPAKAARKAAAKPAKPVADQPATTDQPAT